MAKKLYIKTYGCQMNVYDSARMVDVLAPLGYAPTAKAAGADMIILNTCHIREKAAEKVFSELGRLKHLKDRKKTQGGRMILAVAGCVAQAGGEEILSRAPYVDMVFGPQAYHRLPEMLARAERASGAILDTSFPLEHKFDHLPQSANVKYGSAFLTVQEGCDKFCSFCVVPYTRGAEYSRRTNNIMTEARHLVDAGAVEITLLGQNVNSYHGETPEGSEWGLGRLIGELAKINGLERIRYTTSYPAEMNDELIAAHKDVPQLMPFLHLPIQSGSNNVLAAMNRRHSADDYRRLADKLRNVCPDIALSSDFIVGFPGEADADFNDTLKLIEDVGFIQAYSFKYSARPGTPAAMLENQVDEKIKEQRLATLQDLLSRQQTAFNVSCEGQIMPVLLDRQGRHAGQLIGRSPFMQPVHVKAEESMLGAITKLRIEAAYANSLAGSKYTDIKKERACM